MPDKIWWSDSSGHVAKSLRTLYDEINALAPHRHKGDDGTIGDDSHQAHHSDHNKDAHGVVRALDITHDPANGCDCNAILRAIIASRDDRASYLIFKRKIYNPKIGNWVARPYNGRDPHTGHIHISVVGDAKAEDTRAWSIRTSIPLPTPAPAPIPPPVSRGKASVYGWFDGKHHWEDSGDAAGSAALQVPDVRQGHAFYSRATLGKWFYLTDPKSGRIVLSQQTDIGPHPRTGRSIDIHARIADALGYTQDDFPTDTVWSWRPAPPPAGTEHLTPRQQAKAYTAVQFITSEPPVTDQPTSLPVPTLPPQPGGQLNPADVAEFFKTAIEFMKQKSAPPPPPPPPPPSQGTNMAAALMTFLTWFISVLPQVSTFLAPIFAGLVQGGVVGAPGATTTGTSVGSGLLSMFGVGILNWVKTKWFTPKPPAPPTPPTQGCSS